MICHWHYLRYLLRHKWFVFVECCKLGIPLRGLRHDLSKLFPREWFPYTRYFYGGGRTRETLGDYNIDEAPPYFEKAWNHHQKANDHHWQYWVRFGDDGTILTIPMPDVCRREMLADWRGAGRALGQPDTRVWYTTNRGKMRLHPETRAWIEERLGIELRERLADVQHTIWSHWMDYVFTICPPGENGAVTISPELVERWKRQINTPYAALSPKEQDSDRKEADKVLKVIE